MTKEEFRDHVLDAMPAITARMEGKGFIFKEDDPDFIDEENFEDALDAVTEMLFRGVIDYRG